MQRPKIIFSFGLIALAILFVVTGSLFYPSSRELVIPINRSEIEIQTPGKAAIPAAPIIEPTSKNRSIALRPTPNPRLIEQTSIGILPRKAKAGEKPFDAYARPFELTGLAMSAPKLSLVVIRAGISESVTTEANILLPADVSFSFSPYASEAERQIREIRDRGHEIFLDIMIKSQLSEREDRGPYALDPALPSDINRERLLWMMSRFTSYAGLIADISSSTNQQQSLRDILAQETETRGLGYLDLSRSKFGTSENLPNPTNTIQLPQIIILPGKNSADLADALKKLTIKLAQDRKIIALIDPAPLVLDQIKDWIASHSSHEFDLVPLSALMRLEGQG